MTDLLFYVSAGGIKQFGFSGRRPSVSESVHLSVSPFFAFYILHQWRYSNETDQN